MLANDATPENAPSSPSEWFLPGGLFIWIISLHEFVLFCIGIAIYKYQALENILEFAKEKSHLSFQLGVSYTLILISSGWMIAESLNSFKKSEARKGQIYLFLGWLCGLFFLVIKWLDFNDKLHQGKTFGSNTFWTLYWFLNGFHFIHIFIGSCLLLVFLLKTRKSLSLSDMDGFISLGVFWHACDIIWILLFSTFYLNQ